MRRRLISFFIGVFVLSGACLLGQENKTRTSQIITISDYGVFLEAMASASQKGLLLSLPIEVVAINDFGDQKLVNALGASGVLMRSGKPGSYCYQVVTSESDAPVPFLSWDDAVCYGAWKKTLQEKEGEEGESWGVEVKHGSAEMDHALRSNLFLFQVVDNKTMAHEAVGEEVASGMLDQMLEAILGMGALASAVPRDESVPSRAGERPKDLRSLLSPAPVLDLTISEDVEQREMSKIFTQALTGKAPNYYAKSDAMVPELEQAWEVRAVARQHLQVKEEALEQAQAKFKEEEELLAGKNIEKTALGRIANAAGKASSIASPVSVPIVSLSGIFQGASTLADIANRRIEKHSFKQARTALEKATKEEREARQRFDQLEEAAFALDAARKKPEEEAYRVQQDDAFQVARRLKPPLESNKEEAWQQWAETLLGGTKASRQEIVAFAQKAKTHPNWAAQRAAQAWVERMNHEEQNFRELEEEHKRKLELLEVPYALAQEKAQEARDTATAAYKREEGMIQAESDTHEEYNTVRELLRQLEAQKQKTTMLQQSIEQVKNETRQAYDIWQRAKRELQGNTLANERLIKETEESALHLEAQALKLFQQKEALQKKGARGIERVKAQLVADQRAWRETWPEEVLHQKLQERSGEKLFAVALSSKSQAAWREAQEEAEELGALWQRMKNHPYQGLWKECAKRAALKKIFVEIQERWGAFSDAVQMLVENPNFDPDFKNSQNLAARGEEIVHAMEQALPLINEGLFPVIGTGVNSLARSVRNVVRIAKQKANSPKPLGESTWKDVVKEEAIFKSLEAAEVAPPLWQEEAAWIAQAIQEAGTFAKSIAAPSQDLNKSRYINSAELQELGKALVEETVSQMKKAMYQKQIRYMRARRNFVGRSLEPQKMALFERKKSFYKKERRWKGERGLLERRKKLAPQWKRESLQQEKLSFQGLQGVEKVEMKEADSNKPLEEEVTMDEAAIPLVEGAADPFEDIIDQESHLVEERVVLNQEKRAIDRQEEDLKERTFKLEEDAKVMDQRGALLTKEEAMLAKKKAELFSEQTGREEETSLELVQRRESLRIEEARILQEREALAKEAESLEALASAQLDQKTWESLFKKLHRLIEQEKETVLKARCAEGTDAFMSWLEAHHIAGRAQELWEEIIEDMTRQGEADENSVEKRNAQKEKEMWEYKRKAYIARANELKRKVDQQLLEKEEKSEVEEKRISETSQRLQEVEKMLEQQEQHAMAQEEAISIYHSILEEEDKSNRKIVAAYYHDGEEKFRRQEEALREQEELQTKIAAIFKDNLATYYYTKAFYASSKAAEAKEEKLRFFYNESADAFTEQVKAITLGNKMEGALHGIIGSYFHHAATAYQRSNETVKKDEKVATLQKRFLSEYGFLAHAYEEIMGTHPKFYDKSPSKAAKAYYRGVQYTEQSIEALLKQDKMGAGLHRMMSSFQDKIGFAYKRLAEPEIREDARIATAYAQAIEATEEAVSILASNDHPGAALQMRIADAYYQVAFRYGWEEWLKKDIQDEFYEQSTEHYRASAQSYAQQQDALRKKRESLLQGNQAEALLQKKLAKAHGYLVRTHKSLAGALVASNDDVIDSLLRSAEATEAHVVALVEGNKKEASKQAYIASLWRNAAKAYKESSRGINKNVASVYQECAATYRSSVALLLGNFTDKDIEAFVEAEEKVDSQSSFSNKENEERVYGINAEKARKRSSQASLAVLEKYLKNQEEEKKIKESLLKKIQIRHEREKALIQREEKAAAAYEKCIHVHEQLIAALLAKDSSLALWQQEQVGALNHAALAYRQAAEERRKNHLEATDQCEKGASFYEKEAEAWSNHDEEEALYYRQKAQASCNTAAADHTEQDGEATPAWTDDVQASKVTSLRAASPQVRWGEFSNSIQIFKRNAKDASYFSEITEINSQIEELRNLVSESKTQADASSGDEQTSYQQSNRCFNEAIGYLNNAIIAIFLGNTESAVLWKEAASQSQAAGEKYQAAAEAWLQEDESEVRYADFLAHTFSLWAKSKKYLAQINEAEASGQLNLAKQYHEIVQLEEQAFEYFVRSREADTAGKEEESRNWNQVGHAFLNLANKLGKVLEAEEAGKLSIAQAWRKAVTLQQQSIEFYKKAVAAYALGEEDEAGSWQNAGNTLSYAVAKLGNAVKAEEAQKPVVAKAWREAAELDQQSAVFYSKAAEAYAIGEDKEAKKCQMIADSYYKTAMKLEEEIKAEEAGKRAIS